MHMGWVYASRCVYVLRYIQVPFEMVALRWERDKEREKIGTKDKKSQHKEKCACEILKVGAETNVLVNPLSQFYTALNKNCFGAR